MIFPGLQDQLFVLVTGANSGLGFSICCRIADDFLTSLSRPTSQTLTIIFTTRSAKKSTDTLHRLQEYLRASPHKHHANRVTFIPENIDLCELVSVRRLSRRLAASLPKLDAVILNAGLGGWTGIDWPRAIYGVLTDLVHEVSWPSYKVAPAGVVLDPQLPAASTSPGEEETGEPRLGAVFCANVFGHYMLAHNLMGLLKNSSSSSNSSSNPGRVIWVSSLEATVNYFNEDDIQGLRTTTAYESSKALTDILVLTSNLPSTAPWVNSFYNNHEDKDTTTPNMYLSHPGICGTGILPLNLPLFYCMMIAFWLARILGSPWHTISTYFGACAPVWLAVAPQSDLDDAEEPYMRYGGGRVKWGSSCALQGPAFAASTEVDGWGHGGVVGRAVLDGDRVRRRKRGAVDLTPDEKVKFEELGRSAWRQMEELRVTWDEVLDRAGV